MRKNPLTQLNHDLQKYVAQRDKCNLRLAELESKISDVQKEIEQHELAELNTFLKSHSLKANDILAQLSQSDQLS